MLPNRKENLVATISAFWFFKEDKFEFKKT